MKRVIIIAAMLATTGLAGAQMFAQLFGATGTRIPAVAWYKLDGNALDSSGNGYHGTWTGIEAYTNGPFAGTQAGAFVTGATVAGDNAISALPITVVVWVKHDANMTRTEFFHLNYTTAFRLSVGSSATANSVYSRLSLGETLYNASGGGIISTGAWHHVAAVYDTGATAATVYIDGVVADAKVEDLPLSRITDSKVRLGVVRGFNGGKLDDVRIFDRALSEDNIKRIMESQDNEPLEELQ